MSPYLIPDILIQSARGGNYDMWLLPQFSILLLLRETTYDLGDLEVVIRGLFRQHFKVLENLVGELAGRGDHQCHTSLDFLSGVHHVVDSGEDRQDETQCLPRSLF